MRVMTIAEVAESRGITIIELAELRMDWIERNGDLAFPVTVQEYDWQISQFNAMASKYADQKAINQRGYEYIRRHRDADGAADRSMALSADQVDALMSILRGVE